MQAQQLIEELQPHNLPHLPNGDFTITSKQRDAIESLLSQQEQPKKELLPCPKEEFLLKYFGIKEFNEYQKVDVDLGNLTNLLYQFEAEQIKPLLSQQAVVAQTDDSIVECTIEEQAEMYTEQEFGQRTKENSEQWDLIYRGCIETALSDAAKDYWSNHVRQQLSPQIEGLERWKAEAIAVMPDMQAIGKSIGVPLGQSIHDKILPAIQRLQQQPQLTPEAMQSAAKEYADSQFAAPFDKLNSAGKRLWYAYYNGYLAGKSGNNNK